MPGLGQLVWLLLSSGCLWRTLVLFSMPGEFTEESTVLPVGHMVQTEAEHCGMGWPGSARQNCLTKGAPRLAVFDLKKTWRRSVGTQDCVKPARIPDRYRARKAIPRWPPRPSRARGYG